MEKEMTVLMIEEKTVRKLGRDKCIRFTNSKYGIEARHKSGEKFYYFTDWQAAHEWIINLDESTLEPEHFECRHCDWKGYNPRTLKLPGVSFNVCRKCRGSVKETDEWLAWLHRRQEALRQHAIKHNNGYILGVDVMTKSEREQLEKEEQQL